MKFSCPQFAYFPFWSSLYSNGRSFQRTRCCVYATATLQCQVSHHCATRILFARGAMRIRSSECECERDYNPRNNLILQ